MNVSPSCYIGLTAFQIFCDWRWYSSFKLKNVVICLKITSRIYINREWSKITKSHRNTRVLREDNALYRIKHYAVDSMVCFFEHLPTLLNKLAHSDNSKIRVSSFVFSSYYLGFMWSGVYSGAFGLGRNWFCGQWRVSWPSDIHFDCSVGFCADIQFPRCSFQTWYRRTWVSFQQASKPTIILYLNIIEDSQTHLLLSLTRSAKLKL